MKILTVIGTRPEAIKMIPVLHVLNQRAGMVSRLCLTGQHHTLLAQAMRASETAVDWNLGVMTPDQKPQDVQIAVQTALRPLLETEDPDWVLVHGDTASALGAALAARFARRRLAHVEAGLRSHDPDSPWPEELNRRLIDQLSHLHFAPTPKARADLLAEGFRGETIHMVGNTAVDAVERMRDRLLGDPLLRLRLDTQLGLTGGGGHLILATAHRRESLDAGLEGLCQALRHLAMRDDCQVVFIGHPNPQARSLIATRLDGASGVRILPPIDHLCFVHLMMRAGVILTDSGGIQEEAPSLGVPVLVVRALTERPEAVSLGLARIVGLDPGRIVAAATACLNFSRERRHNRAANPFGDGHAAERIVDVLAAGFNPGQAAPAPAPMGGLISASQI